jgi:chemotaxis protein MotB
MMKQVLKDYALAESVDVEQMAEGIKIRVKDKIVFKQGSTEIDNRSFIPVFKKITNLMKDNDWHLHIEGYADAGEVSNDGKDLGPYLLSAKRVEEVTKVLIKNGVRPEKISSVFYGDSRAVADDTNRKVEFVMRKRDLRTEGRKVRAQ